MASNGYKIVLRLLLVLLFLGAAQQRALAAPGVTMSAYQVSGDYWVIEGWVDANDPEAVQLTFSGLPSLAGITGTPDETGYFLVFLTLQPDEGGLAQVQATDDSGSAFAYAFIE